MSVLPAKGILERSSNTPSRKSRNTWMRCGWLNRTWKHVPLQAQPALNSGAWPCLPYNLRIWSPPKLLGGNSVRKIICMVAIGVIHYALRSFAQSRFLFWSKLRNRRVCVQEWSVVRTNEVDLRHASHVKAGLGCQPVPSDLIVPRTSIKLCATRIRTHGPSDASTNPSLRKHGTMF